MTTPEELANECAENIYVNARTKEDSAELILDNIPLKELLDVARAAKNYCEAENAITAVEATSILIKQLRALQQKGIEL